MSIPDVERAAVQEALSEAVAAVTEAVMTALGAGVPEGAANGSGSPRCARCGVQFTPTGGSPIGADELCPACNRATAGADFDEAVAQMSDDEHYAQLRRTDQRHACPVEGCRLSAEEHHRLAKGMIAENNEMRRRLKTLEGNT